MGGHSSSLSANVTTNIVSSGVYDASQNCVVDASGGQSIIIDGSGNIIDGVDQIMDLQISSNCYQSQVTNTDLQSAVDNQIAQTLADQQVAMTQWLDNGGDSVNSNIATSVTSNITIDNTQNCVEALNASQLLLVRGNSNVVRNVLQQQSAKGMLTCMQESENTSSFVQDTTNSVNQHSDYTSENPFAFITDAIAAMFKSALMAAAVIFIIIIALVFLFMVLHHKKPAATPEFIVWPGLGTVSASRQNVTPHA